MILFPKGSLGGLPLLLTILRSGIMAFGIGLLGVKTPFIFILEGVLSSLSLLTIT